MPAFFVCGKVKDPFFFRQGPRLAIPDGAKPGLFRRMRGRLTADNLSAMLVRTLALVLAANLRRHSGRMPESSARDGDFPTGR